MKPQIMSKNIKEQPSSFVNRWSELSFMAPIVFCFFKKEPLTAFLGYAITFFKGLLDAKWPASDKARRWSMVSDPPSLRFGGKVPHFQIICRSQSPSRRNQVKKDKSISWNTDSLKDNPSSLCPKYPATNFCSIYRYSFLLLPTIIVSMMGIATYCYPLCHRENCFPC